jgi:hypothetical protein
MYHAVAEAKDDIYSKCTYVNQITFKMENKKKFCPVIYALYSTEHAINILVQDRTTSHFQKA